MRELVLSIRGAELESPELLRDLRVEPGGARFEGRSLALSHDRSFDIALRLLDYLLDMRGVDTPIEHQLLHGLSRHLPPNGIKARNRHCLRRVVYDHIH